MQIVNPAEAFLSVFWFPVKIRPGAPTATFVVKATCVLPASGPMIPVEKEPALPLGDAPHDDDPKKGPRYPSDFAPFKPRAEWMVAGRAWAPRGQKTAFQTVQAQVAGQSKTLVAIGDRRWEKHLIGGQTATEAEPFESMPLRWDLAFGGPRDRRNPVGRGKADDRLPNVEFPDRLVKSPGAKVEAAGFGPLDPAWEPRSELIGSYRGKWAAERWPYLPPDFDMGHFNAAPADQRLDGYFRGDERVTLVNLHPDLRLFDTKLPGLRARLFLDLKPEVEGRDGAFREIALDLDTLWIDTEEERAVLVWRALAEVPSIRLKEVEHLFVLTESLVEPPKSPAACRAVMMELLAEPAEEPTVTDPAWAEFDASMKAMDEEAAAAEKEFADLESAGAEAEAKEEKDAVARGVPASAFAATGPPPPAGPTHPEQAAAFAAHHPAGKTLVADEAADAADAEASMKAMDEEEKAFAAEAEEPPTREWVEAHAAARGSFARLDLSRLDLSGLDLSGLEFRKADFTGCILAGTKFTGADLTEASLRKVDLASADLSGAVLDDATFRGSSLAGTKIRSASLNSTDLSRLDLSGLDFSGCRGKNTDLSRSKLGGATFRDASLPGADFSKSELEKADFEAAELVDADFNGAGARGASFTRADLTGFRGEDVDLREAKLDDAHGPGIILQKARLDRASVTGAMFRRGQLDQSSWREAILDRTDLADSNLDDADLQGASARHVNLLRSSLERADLRDADFEGANLFEAGALDAQSEGARFDGANRKRSLLERR